MDKNQTKAIGFVFLLFLMLTYKQMVWDPYFKGKSGEAPASPTPAASSSSSAAAPSGTPDYSVPPVSAAAKPETSQVSPAAPAAAPSAAPKESRYPSDGELQAGGELSVKTGLFAAKFSLLGGRMTSFELGRYDKTLTPGGGRVNLVEHIEGAPYPLGVYSGPESDAWVNYQLVSATVAKGSDGVYSVDDGSDAIFQLQGTLADGRTIKKRLAVNGAKYFVDVLIELGAPAPDQSRLELEWTKLIPVDSPTILDPYAISGFAWFDGNKATRVPFSKFKTDQQVLGDVGWVSLADKYFTTTMISPEKLAPGRAIKTSQLYRSRLAGTVQDEHVLIYAGPKSYGLLKDSGWGLERNIDFGWAGVISVPLLALLHFLFGILKNYGLAIIVLTVIVKLALLPLTATQFKQMKAMQKLQPEMQRIRETITDSQQQQQEMIGLYKKHGVNPLGGCFPMFIQLPIFVGLYNALLLSIELRHAPFALWIKDLSAPERLTVFGVGIPVLVILFIVSMFISQLTMPQPSDPTQKKIMMFMPLIVGYMFMNLPAGLALYWLTNNVISIAQAYALRTEGEKSPLILTLIIAVVTFLFAAGLTLIH